MPKKPNHAGQMQEYVPAGNGDASGEYGDSGGSNKHFKAFYKAQVNGEIKGKTGEETLVKHSEKYEAAKQHIINGEKVNLETGKALKMLTDEEYEELKKLKEDLEAEKQDKIKAEEEAEKEQEAEETKELLNSIEPKDKKIEKQFKKYSKDDYKNYLLAFEDEFDKDKIESLSEEELKQLAIAKANTLIKNKDYNKDFAKILKSLNEVEGSQYGSVWAVNVPKTLDELKESLDEKKKWFNLQDDVEQLEKQLTETTSDSHKTWLENKIKSLKNFKETVSKIEDGLIPEWEKAYKENQKLLDDLEESEKLIDKFANPNNVYSENAKNKAHWFKNQSQSEKYFKDIQKTYDKIGEEDLEKIKSYTASYSFINEPLRKLKYTGYNGDGPKFKKYVKGMTNAIDKSPLKENMWFQRGIHGLNINGNNIGDLNINDLVGTVFEDQGFVSCGTHKGGGFSDNPIIMNIYAPKGTKALYVAPISSYKNEDETIIQRGYSYKITKAYKNNGKIYLDCEVILGSDEKKYDEKELDELSKKYF